MSPKGTCIVNAYCQFSQQACTNLFVIINPFLYINDQFAMINLKPRTFNLGTYILSYNSLTEGQWKFRPSTTTTFSSNRKSGLQYPMSYFVIGWIVLKHRRSKFPSNWLSGRLSYQSTYALRTGAIKKLSTFKGEAICFQACLLSQSKCQEKNNLIYLLFWSEFCSNPCLHTSKVEKILKCS